MSREVFQANKIVLFVIMGVVFVGVTIAYLNSIFPVFVLPIVFVIGLFIIISSMKTKLIVEDGMLRYEKLFGGEEVELKRVSQIIIREVETMVSNSTSQSVFNEQDNATSEIRVGNVRLSSGQNVDAERKIEKVMYVQDASGRTIFSAPANLVGFSQRKRFREAIHKDNPNIHVF